MSKNTSSEYVKLISSDKFEFIIKRDIALFSGTIKNMLSSPGQFMESEQNTIHFRDIKYGFQQLIINSILQYLMFQIILVHF
ncbi:POZ domain-containing protein [Gigaspora margarita]|uniref:Elongin-C n=1 Tax=Gigaspora margarita TaxID=4874 RepID=A0A8H3XC84_GIGMA|nr:POZ domain-containing protein [Gigaspora margarita]